jgi:uncharacterized protein
MENYVHKTAEELGILPHQVTACFDLLINEATVPFIARYRKEATGGLDELKVTRIKEKLEAFGELNARRESIMKSLRGRGVLSDELREPLMAAETLSVLEDVYLPYRPKRRTRGAAAREKGLGPLAAAIMRQDPEDDPEELCLRHLKNSKRSVIISPEEALSGAKDVIAELVNENQEARGRLRSLFEEESIITTRVVAGKEELGLKFENYFDAEEHILRIPSHRYLAMRRGEAEGFLTLTIQPDVERALSFIRPLFVKNGSKCARVVDDAVKDAYKRLLSLSLETEIRLKIKKRADQEAIEVFAKNFQELLMAAPWGKRAILAIDPGLRTGCKIVALSQDGELLEYQTIYPHGGEESKKLASAILLAFLDKHKLTAIAIGNGTGGRETERFVREITEIPKEIPTLIVSETGASIYSASEEARGEFPHLDLTIRSAISIGRRLIDPLAELVKIEPRSIGVGQYQHDVDQLMLKNSLDNVVMSCVNQVGVEANSASERLLSYVSGLGPTLAKNFVKYRKDHGPFKSREEFLKVPRLGPKIFEQCAGFLRIRDGENPLDKSAVHPESYGIVQRMAKDLKVSVSRLMEDKELRSQIAVENYQTPQAGLPTLNDILTELDKPGRDPRDVLEPLAFSPMIHKPEDLSPGMRIPGVVVNVTAFGAFVDIGVHLDGLIHLSELADRYINAPSEVVKVGQKVVVTVLVVDISKGRISLSLRENADRGERRLRPTGPHRLPPQPRREDKPYGTVSGMRS